MGKINGEIVFSASELLYFLDCEHIPSLALIDLSSIPAQFPGPQPELLDRTQGQLRDGMRPESHQKEQQELSARIGA